MRWGNLRDELDCSLLSYVKMKVLFSVAAHGGSHVQNPRACRPLFHELSVHIQDELANRPTLGAGGKLCGASGTTIRSKVDTANVTS
jgi:hypothetical protein